MKTKLLFTVIFLLSFLENSFSQEYHPFLNNSSWILMDQTSCCVPSVSKVVNEGTDVVIGAYTYKKFNDPFPEYSNALSSYIDTVYVREDVAAKKVYKIVNGSDALLYDFNMETGDTITQYGYTFTVTLVDEIDCNGSPRKRITLQVYSTYYHRTFTQKWIEGVGSNAHPFYPERNMYSVLSASGGYNFYTRCSFQDGEHIYGEADCPDVMTQFLNVTDNDYSNQHIVFSPNPFTTELTVSSELFLQNASFKLYNLQGQLVREMKNLSGQKIIVNRENLNSGLYFAQLFENDKLIKSGKMMVD